MYIFCDFNSLQVSAFLWTYLTINSTLIYILLQIQISTILKNGSYAQLKNSNMLYIND